MIKLNPTIEDAHKLCINIIFTMIVKRLVKHTGYGNAAGLLARRGLMAGGSGSRGIQYSDDDDSDTEEYRQNAHM